MAELEMAKELIDFIDKSYTSFHAVEESIKILEENKFKYISLDEKWDIEKGGKYYTVKNDSAIVAFTIGKDYLPDLGFRMIASHTDSPGFRIKPSPELLENGYIKLNTEVYGGPILNTWLDKSLSIAGKVSILSNDPLKPKIELVNLSEFKLIIPNLAIHMNREVNDGFKLNPQTHMLPLAGLVNEEMEDKNYLIKKLAEKLKIDEGDILDFELYLYPREKGEIVGINDEFISAGKLDNLAMLEGSIKAIVGEESKAINMIVGFDNEEVGSSTKQGAGSPFVRDLMERIYYKLGYNKEDFLIGLENSILISSDMAHAVHPNFGEKADLTNKPVINGGPCIKIAANQAYTTDSKSSAIYEGICRSLDIPVQKFVNRSDARGGSTIGPISSSQLPITSVDVGSPILSMHSIKELGGVKDHYYIVQIFKKFFSL